MCMQMRTMAFDSKARRSSCHSLRVAMGACFPVRRDPFQHMGLALRSGILELVLAESLHVVTLDPKRPTEPVVLDGTTLEGIFTKSHRHPKRDSVTRNKQSNSNVKLCGIKVIQGRCICRMQSRPRRFILPNLQRTTVKFPLQCVAKSDLLTGAGSAETPVGRSRGRSSLLDGQMVTADADHGANAHWSVLPAGAAGTAEATAGASSKLIFRLIAELNDMQGVLHAAVATAAGVPGTTLPLVREEPVLGQAWVPLASLRPALATPHSSQQLLGGQDEGWQFSDACCLGACACARKAAL